MSSVVVCNKVGTCAGGMYKRDVSRQEKYLVGVYQRDRDHIDITNAKLLKSTNSWIDL